MRDSVAWLAGLMEGEGNFGFTRIKGHKYARLQIGMNDRDILERAAKILRAKVYGPYGPYLNNRQQNFRIVLHGMIASDWMKRLYPYMGYRRRKQIERVIGGL